MYVVTKQGGTAEILRPCNIYLLQRRIFYLRQTDCRGNNQAEGCAKVTAL